MGITHPSPGQSQYQQEADPWRSNKLSALRRVKFQLYKLFMLYFRTKTCVKLRKNFKGRRLIGNGCRLKQETFAFTKIMDQSRDKKRSVSTCQICRNICTWLVVANKSDI